MYCPNCSQEQMSKETKFCSRCGFLMTGVMELIENGGVLSKDSELQKSSANTPRKRGLKKGLFIFLLTFLIVPLISIITVAINAKPYGVVIAAIILSVGGLLRMAYALLFESNQGADDTNFTENVIGSAQNFFSKKRTEKALPSHQTMAAETYIPPTQGNWRDTKDLVQTNLTEETTKFFQKDI